MSLTKYPERVFSPSRGCATAAETPAGDGGSGAIAPLVSIEEHLTFIPEPAFRKSSCAGRLLQGWSSPVEGFDLGSNEFGGNYVVKIQPFKAGGYELSCRSLDLEKIGAAMVGERRFGKRERPEVPDSINVQKAAARAKRRVRHLTKNMGASHLVTFTRRETEAGGTGRQSIGARHGIGCGVCWSRLRGIPLCGCPRKTQERQLPLTRCVG